MLHFIQVHRTLSVKGVQIHSVESKTWRVSAHFITHYQNVWLFFLVLCAISPHQGSIESRKIRPKSPRNQWKPFIQLIFSSFNFMFQCFFFYLKGCSPLNISDQRLQNGRFPFSLKNRFFKVVAEDWPASKLSYLGGRSEPRENTWAGSPAPRFRVFSCAFTFRDRWGVGAVSAEHCSQDMQKTLLSSHVKTELGTRLNCFDCHNNVHHVR